MAEYSNAVIPTNPCPSHGSVSVLGFGFLVSIKVGSVFGIGFLNYRISARFFGFFASTDNASSEQRIPNDAAAFWTGIATYMNSLNENDNA